MSKITHAQAESLVQDLKQMGINDDGIRLRLANEGFSSSESNKILASVRLYTKQKYAFNQASKSYQTEATTIAIEKTFERGILLTAFMILQGLAGIGGIIGMLHLLAFTNIDSTSDPIFGINFVLLSFMIIQLFFVRALWHGKKAGYDSLRVLYLLAIGISYYSTSFSWAIPYVVLMVLLLLLVQPKSHLLT